VRVAGRATDIAERLGLDFGLVHKERKKRDDEEPAVTFVGDVNGKARLLARPAPALPLRRHCCHTDSADVCVYASLCLSLCVPGGHYY
jgi:hypothetical protein